MKQLERGDVNVVDLKKNIEYAASVLEAVYIDETRYALAPFPFIFFASLPFSSFLAFIYLKHEFSTS